MENKRSIDERVKRLNLLYVEDEDETRGMVVRFMSRYVNSIVAAKDGLEGYELFVKKQDEIDLIISDINMPRLSGLEMAKKIRAIRPDVKLIFLTAYSDSDTIMDAIELGVSSFVPKPLNFARLVGEVSRIAIDIHNQKRYQRERLEDIKAQLQEEMGSNIQNYLLNSTFPSMLIGKDDTIVSCNELFRKVCLKDEQLYKRLGDGSLKITDVLKFSGVDVRGDWKKDIVLFGDAISKEVSVVTDSIHKYEIELIPVVTQELHIAYIKQKAQEARSSDLSMSRILVIESDESIMMSIKEGLAGLDCEILEARDGESGLELALKDRPSLIFVDLMLSMLNGIRVLEELKKDSYAKLIPTVVVSQLDNQVLANKCMGYGVKGFVNTPVKSVDIRESALRILADEKKCLPIEQRVPIVALANFQNGGFSGRRMTGIAKLAVERFASLAIDDRYLFCSLNLLSCVLNHSDYTKAVEFAKDCILSNEFVELLRELSSPIMTRALLINSILKMERLALARRLDESSPANEIEEYLLSLYKANTIVLDDGINISDAMEYYTTLIDGVDTKIKDSILRLLSGVSSYLFFHNNGGFLQLERTPSYIRLALVPRSIRNVERMELLLDSLERSEKQVNVYFEQVEKKTGIVIEFSLLAPTEISKTTQMEVLDNGSHDESQFFDFSSGGTAVPSYVDVVKKSAKEFLATADVDMDDIRTLVDIEKDINEAIVQAEYTNNPIKMIQTIAELFRSYGTNIIYLTEFNAISNALISLGNSFINLQDKKLSDAFISMVPYLFENLCNDLRIWRESIFVHMDSMDIHSLDASIISSCEQCIGFLTPQKSDDSNAGEVELF